MCIYLIHKKLVSLSPVEKLLCVGMSQVGRYWCTNVVDSNLAGLRWPRINFLNLGRTFPRVTNGGSCKTVCRLVCTRNRKLNNISLRPRNNMCGGARQRPQCTVEARRALAGIGFIPHGPPGRPASQPASYRSQWMINVGNQSPKS